VELLLLRGADAAARNRAGRTARDVVGAACTAARLTAVLQALQTAPEEKKAAAQDEAKRRQQQWDEQEAAIQGRVEEQERRRRADRERADRQALADARAAVRIAAQQAAEEAANEQLRAAAAAAAAPASVDDEPQAPPAAPRPSQTEEADFFDAALAEQQRAERLRVLAEQEQKRAAEKDARRLAAEAEAAAQAAQQALDEALRRAFHAEWDGQIRGRSLAQVLVLFGVPAAEDTPAALTRAWKQANARFHPDKNRKRDAKLRVEGSEMLAIINQLYTERFKATQSGPASGSAAH
jgi:hypothetical protein